MSHTHTEKFNKNNNKKAEKTLEFNLIFFLISKNNLSSINGEFIFLLISYFLFWNGGGRWGGLKISSKNKNDIH